jgi:hypothetical protein
LIKVLIASAIFAPLASYFFLESSHQYIDVQPQPTIETTHVAFLSLPQGMLGLAGIAIEVIAEAEVQLQPARSEMDRQNAKLRRRQTRRIERRPSAASMLRSMRQMKRLSGKASHLRAVCRLLPAYPQLPQ